MFASDKDITDIKYDITQQDKIIDKLEKRITDLEYKNKIALFKLTYNPLPFSMNYVSTKEVLLAIVEHLNLDMEYIPESLPTVKLNKKGDAK